jgi:hypothetical protein
MACAAASAVAAPESARRALRETLFQGIAACSPARHTFEAIGDVEKSRRSSLDLGDRGIG